MTLPSPALLPDLTPDICTCGFRLRVDDDTICPACGLDLIAERERDISYLHFFAMTSPLPDTCHDSARIRALNDAFRTRQHLIGSLIALGDLVVARGVASHGPEFVTRAVAAVRNFNDFTPNNDPYEEHDWGAFDLEGERLNWKIDYYDLEREMGSPCPSDPAQTRRVLTILLAEEY